MVTKKQKPKSPRFPKKKIITVILCVLALIVCLLAAYITYDRHQQREEDARSYTADKARFAQIEQDVEQVKANLEPKLQPGDTATISKSCGYTSAKFEKGTLRCGVYLDVFYADKNIDMLDEIVKSAQATGRFMNNSNNTFSRSDEYGKTRRSKTVYSNDGKNNFCNINQLDYGSTEYVMSCSGVVKEPIYTVIN